MLCPKQNTCMCSPCTPASKPSVLMSMLSVPPPPHPFSKVCRRPAVPSPLKPGVCGAMYRMTPMLQPPPRRRHPTLTAAPVNLSTECQPRGAGTCGASGKWRQHSVPGAFLATNIPHCRPCLKRRNFSTIRSYL